MNLTGSQMLVYSAIGIILGGSISFGLHALFAFRFLHDII